MKMTDANFFAHALARVMQVNGNGTTLETDTHSFPLAILFRMKWSFLQAGLNPDAFLVLQDNYGVVYLEYAGIMVPAGHGNSLAACAVDTACNFLSELDAIMEGGTQA